MCAAAMIPTKCAISHSPEWRRQINSSAREPDAVAAAVRAIVKAQKALRTDPSLAREVGKRKFPADAAELITNVVARDIEFLQSRDY